MPSRVWSLVSGAAHRRTLSRCAQAGNVLFEEWQKEIDVSFGLATIMTAIVATLAGAWLVDHLGSSIRTSMLFCGISTLLGFGLLQAAFAIPDTFPVFLALFALGEVACFAGTAPASEPHLPWAAAGAALCEAGAERLPKHPPATCSVQCRCGACHKLRMQPLASHMSDRASCPWQACSPSDTWC